MHEASALNQLLLNYINFVLEPEYTDTHTQSNVNASDVASDQ